MVHGRGANAESILTLVPALDVAASMVNGGQVAQAARPLGDVVGEL